MYRDTSIIVISKISQFTANSRGFLRIIRHVPIVFSPPGECQDQLAQREAKEMSQTTLPITK